MRVTAVLFSAGLILSGCTVKTYGRPPNNVKQSAPVYALPPNMSRTYVSAPPEDYQDAYRQLDFRCAAAEAERDVLIDTDSGWRVGLTIAGIGTGALATFSTAAAVAQPDNRADQARTWQISSVLLSAVATGITSFLAGYRFDARIDNNRTALSKIQTAREVARSSWLAAKTPEEQRAVLLELARACGNRFYLESSLQTVPSPTNSPPPKPASSPPPVAEHAG